MATTTLPHATLNAAEFYADAWFALHTVLGWAEFDSIDEVLAYNDDPTHAHYVDSLLALRNVEETIVEYWEAHDRLPVEQQTELDEYTAIALAAAGDLYGIEIPPMQARR